VFYDPPVGTIDAGDADAFIHSESGVEYDLMEGVRGVVEPSGDVNGDGFDDLLIGGLMSARYYLVYGGPV